MRDGEAVVINTTSVDMDDIAGELRRDPATKHLADTLGAWVERVSESPAHSSAARRRRRVGGLLERDRWLNPGSTFGKIRLAREAMTDDIVGNAADGTEAFTLAKVGIYTDDEDEEDVWNQWAGDINLDDQLRKGWRVLFSDSQFAAVTWWDRRTYKVRGTTSKGNQKRKKFENLLVPVGWTYLDTTKVVPIGNLMFGQERLAYCPTPMEAMRIVRVLAKRDNQPIPTHVRPGPRLPLRRIPDVLDALELDDPFIEQLITRRYLPDREEMRLLQDDGIDPNWLFEMRPDMAFRHTLTRPDYQRFADVRLEGIFVLLDLKAQLQQLDRVSLIGGAHFIILVTIGDDKIPGTQPEIDAFRAQAFTLATVPVVVGDQRLKIEIITPKQDHTLERTKWDTINAPISARVWSAFHHDVSRTEDPTKTAKVIAKNLESRRLMLRRTIEREVIDRMRNRNSEDFTGRAKLIFTPAQISLAFDAALASFLLELRASNEISRNTTLGTFDISQEDEYRMRKREQVTFDKVLKTIPPAGTPKPGGAAAPPADPGKARAEQRRAGRKAPGGGTADGSGRGQAARRPLHKSNENQKPVAATLLEAEREELLDMAKELEIVGRHKMTKGQLRAEIRRTRAERRDALLRDAEDIELELDDLEDLDEEEEDSE